MTFNKCRSIIWLILLSACGQSNISVISSPTGSSSATTATTLATPTLAITTTNTSAISMSWGAIGGATGYTLFMDGDQVATTSSTYYTDTNFSVGVQHCFAVKATSSIGSSTLSAAACTTPVDPLSGSASNNVMNVTVDGSLCSASTTQDVSYMNKPCVSVTVCQPGTSNCQTISDILVDTGSYGLRIFPSGTNADGSTYTLSPLNLSAVTQSGQAVATCAQFLDGSALWGSVARADVILVSGGERASSIPIQIINSSYGGGTPSDCDNGVAASTAADAHFNGIMGVGLWEQDCGATCDPDSYTGTGDTVASLEKSGDIEATYYPYYTCSGSTCTQAFVSLANQVTNPVSALPVNNNGLIFELPSISASGVASVSGSIVLGIGTGGNTNNALSGSAKTYYADDEANFVTAYNGLTYEDQSSPTATITGSFIDSGSNTLLFTPPSADKCCEQDGSGDPTSTLVACTSASSSGWVCDSFSLSPTNGSANYSTGTLSGSETAVALSVADFFTLTASGDMVFSNLAEGQGSCTDKNPCTFDYGLPFFFGRNIYIGFQQISATYTETAAGNALTTTLVKQPYWAY